jgi:hypothetical protein
LGDQTWSRVLYQNYNNNGVVWQPMSGVDHFNLLNFLPIIIIVILYKFTFIWSKGHEIGLKYD